MFCYRVIFYAHNSSFVSVCEYRECSCCPEGGAVFRWRYQSCGRETSAVRWSLLSCLHLRASHQHHSATSRPQHPTAASPAIWTGPAGATEPGHWITAHAETHQHGEGNSQDFNHLNQFHFILVSCAWCTSCEIWPIRVMDYSRDEKLTGSYAPQFNEMFPGLMSGTL